MAVWANKFFIKVFTFSLMSLSTFYFWDLKKFPFKSLGFFISSKSNFIIIMEGDEVFYMDQNFGQ